ncbi:MAG: hypothetical protein HZB76_03875 [Chlamydiae bacterium]|nr:hypothetical protein [Chlamydiota bacterium]
MLKKFLLFLFSFLIPLFLWADCKEYEPWYTGPFEADSATNIPKGDVGIYPYYYYQVSHAQYTPSGTRSSLPTITMQTGELALQVGITKWLDITFDSRVVFSKQLTAKTTEISDTYVKLGFQLAKDKKGAIMPAVRFIIRETFPTGKYKNLNPDKRGLDSSGSGSYETDFGLRFSKTVFWWKCHPIKFVFTLDYNVLTDVSVQGFNTYGGGFGTDGSIKPGRTFYTIFSFDFSLTQKFAFSMDTVFGRTAGSSFNGQTGFDVSGASITNQPAIPFGQLVPITVIATRPENTLSISVLFLSPALEYNFSPNLGVIVTYLISMYGTNTLEFRTVAANLSYSF